MNDIQPPAHSISRTARISARASQPFLLALCVLFVALAGVYSWVVPPLEGFDATAHFLASVYYRDHLAPPPLNDATVQTSFELVTQPPLYHLLAGKASAGWSSAEAKTYAESVQNPYFGGSSKRQTVILPDTPTRLLIPIWIARLVSMLGGLLTVIATWIFVRSYFPYARSLAVATTALLGFNPQFLFMSATVTNDAWAAATIAMTVALASRAVLQRRSDRYWLRPGVAGGLAVLTKYSGFIVGVPVLVLLIALAVHTSVGRALRSAGYGLLGGAAVAGAWYLRMMIVYREFVPFAAMAEAIPALYRDPPYTWARTLEHLPWLRASYWGVFVANIAPPSYLEVMRWFMWIGAVGLIIFLVRKWREAYAEKWLAVAVAGSWTAVVGYSVLNWTRTVSYGEQGRLAHIAAPAIALLLVLGWQGFWPQKWTRAVHVAISVLALGLALSQVFTLRNAYSMPDSVEEPSVDRRIDATFEGGMQLIGVDYPEGAALESDSPMPLTLYFSADEPIDEFYTLFIHLADADNNLLYQFDGPPVGGRHATRQWRPGEIFADTYEIVLPEIGHDGLAQLSVGFYPFEQMADRVTVYDSDGTPVGDRLLLADVRLHAEPADVAVASATDVGSLAKWSNGIALQEAQVQLVDSDAPEAVELTWQSQQVMHEDLTMFVQVLDTDNQVLAHADRRPHEGEWPTSTWRAGDTIRTEVPLNWVDGDNAEPWQHVIVGWYDRQGERVPLAEPTVGESYYELASR